MQRATGTENKAITSAILQLILLFLAMAGLVFFFIDRSNGRELYLVAGTILLGAFGYYFVSRRVIGKVEDEMNDHNQYISDASHELRTPLTIMRTNLEVALKHPEKVDPIPAMEDVLQEVNRMQKIVEDLLMLSRNYLMEPSLTDPQYTDIHQLLSEICQKLSAYAETHKVTITYDGSRAHHLSHYLVRGGKVRLSEAIMNVIRNSIEYAKPEGGTITVRLVPNYNQTVTVIISDDGIGIKPHDLENVFNRFYQVDKSRAVKEGGGSGLGLPISKSIIERYDGTMEIRSSLGKGTTVSMVLNRAVNV